MEKVIVLLLIWIIVRELIAISNILKTSSKESAIEFYQHKIKQKNESKLSKWNEAFASLIALSICSAVIYYAIQAVFTFIK